LKNKINKIVLENFDPPKSLAGLQKSKKIIRAEILKEAQFAKICSQIRLEDFKKKRAEKQKNERIAKRA
jgi:hypothetical protein